MARKEVKRCLLSRKLESDTCVLMYVCVYTYVHTYEGMYVCMYVHYYARMCVYTYVHTYEGMYVCMYVHMHIGMYVCTMHTCKDSEEDRRKVSIGGQKVLRLFRGCQSWRKSFL